MTDRRVLIEPGYRRDLTEAQADLLRDQRLIYDRGGGQCGLTHGHMEACDYDLARAAEHVEKILAGGENG